MHGTTSRLEYVKEFCYVPEQVLVHLEFLIFHYKVVLYSNIQDKLVVLLLCYESGHKTF